MRINQHNLELAMATACLSVTELSIRSGINRMTLRRIRNNGENVRPDTVGKLARGLECDIEYLIIDDRKGTKNEQISSQS